MMSNKPSAERAVHKQIAIRLKALKGKIKLFFFLPPPPSGTPPSRRRRV